MKNRSLGFICCCFLFSASMWGQEPLSSDLNQQVTQIAKMIKDNPKGAEEGFDGLLKGKNKKNIPLLLSIGKAYLDAGNADMAKEYAERARKADSKSASVYMFLGDIALAGKDAGAACGNYEQAIFFDEDCYEAYYKYARAYAGVNPQLSVDMLMKLKERHPEELNVDRELANAYYLMGNYSKAKSAYDDFMQKGTPNVQDYGRYAMLLYLNKDYQHSLDMAGKGLAMEADNHLLKRLMMYGLYELKSYPAGLQAANEFFKDPNNPDFVYLDYLYRARLYLANGNNDEAIAEFEKALKADEKKEHPEVAKEMSDAYGKMLKYPDAIRMYQVYMDMLGDKKEVSDLFLFGRLYYQAAGALAPTNTADSTAVAAAPVDTVMIKKQQNEYLTQADTIFAEVSQRVPDNYLGYFWRARTNAMLDLETTLGLAKPYYEAALAQLEKNPNASKSLLIECESYLGYYYFLKEEYEQSKVYWTKILEIDPENATAKQAMEGLQ